MEPGPRATRLGADRLGRRRPRHPPLGVGVRRPGDGRDAPDRPVGESAHRLRTLVDGYGLPAAERPALAATLGPRARAMYDLLCAGARDGVQPWARIHAEDGPYWRSVADHLTAHVDDWTRALT